MEVFYYKLMSVPKRFKFKKIYLKTNKNYKVQSLKFFRGSQWYAEANLLLLYARCRVN